MTLEPPEITIAKRASADDPQFELACALYAHGQVSAVSGANLSGLDLLTFQAALKEREIPRQYSVEDLDHDMATLDKLFPA